MQRLLFSLHLNIQQDNVDIGEIDDHHCLTQIYDCSPSRLDTGTSITSVGIKPALWAQSSPVSEMMR
jgi:hypothetical protein